MKLTRIAIGAWCLVLAGIWAPLYLHAREIVGWLLWVADEVAR